MKYALFIGRWQPFHLGHKFIIDQALEKGENVMIGIRDTPIDEHNPYSMNERMNMIRKSYRGNDKVHSMSIPDISSVNVGRLVGYDVNRFDAPKDIEGISATEIRNLIDQGDDSWKAKVPEGSIEYLEELHA